MPASKYDTERGNGYNINGQHFLLLSSSGITAATEPVVDDVVAVINDVESTYQPDKQVAAIDGRIGAMLSASKSAIAEATEAARDTAKATATTMTAPPTIAAAAERLGPEIRSRLAALTPAERHAALADADAVTIAAAREQEWALLPGTLDATREAADERAVLLYHVERSGMAGSHPAQPSVDRIIATGTDDQAVQTAARAALVRHRERIEAVEADEGAARGLVGIVAAALHITPAAALARIVGA